MARFRKSVDLSAYENKNRKKPQSLNPKRTENKRKPRSLTPRGKVINEGSGFIIPIHQDNIEKDSLDEKRRAIRKQAQQQKLAEQQRQKAIQREKQAQQQKLAEQQRQKAIQREKQAQQQKLAEQQRQKAIQREKQAQQQRQKAIQREKQAQQQKLAEQQRQKAIQREKQAQQQKLAEQQRQKAIQREKQAQQQKLAEQQRQKAIQREKQAQQQRQKTQPKKETTTQKEQKTQPKKETTTQKEQKTQPKKETTTQKEQKTQPKKETTTQKEQKTQPKKETTTQKEQKTEETLTNVDEVISTLIPNYQQDLAIEVKHVSLSFEVRKERIDNLKEYVIRSLKRNKGKGKVIQALDDVSFKLYKGEKIGIIGYNGAGKSTLLKVISGIYKPEQGSVKVNGRLSPLLGLNSGFDPNFPGRDNIFFNGAVLGYDRKFLESKYNEIVEFSELGEYINIPIKNYSSGMMAKLGFSIASMVNPDILIIDEVLGVGDINFAKKSKAKMRELMNSGCTVILVSHSLPQIRANCDKAIWIDNGKVREIGEVNKVCDHYIKDAEKATSTQLQNMKLK